MRDHSCPCRGQTLQCSHKMVSLVSYGILDSKIPVSWGPCTTIHIAITLREDDGWSAVMVH